MKKPEKRFCEKCGIENISHLEGAEIKYNFMGYSFPVSTKFEETTGRRQYVWKYICPKFRSSWWAGVNGHSNYIIKDIVFK